MNILDKKVSLWIMLVIVLFAFISGIFVGVSSVDMGKYVLTKEEIGVLYTWGYVDAICGDLIEHTSEETYSEFNQLCTEFYGTLYDPAFDRVRALANES